MRIFIFVAVISLLLSSCSSPVRQGGPAPVISQDGYQASQPYAVASLPKSDSRSDGNVTVTPLKADEPITAKPQTNKVVVLLQERATDQIRAGRQADAARSLERALNIDPDNAKSWNLLAHLRADQKKYEMAVEIAAKSNSLVSSDNVSLKRDNLLLIAEMKSRLGDVAAADRYRRLASSLN